MKHLTWNERLHWLLWGLLQNRLVQGDSVGADTGWYLPEVEILIDVAGKYLLLMLLNLFVFSPRGLSSGALVPLSNNSFQQSMTVPCWGAQLLHLKYEKNRQKSFSILPLAKRCPSSVARPPFQRNEKETTFHEAENYCHLPTVNSPWFPYLQNLCFTVLYFGK